MNDRVSTYAKSVPLKTIYFTIVLCFVSTFILGCFVFTIEADESWMLMSAMKAFGIELVETSALDDPVTTSGGVYLAIHGLMALLNVDILHHRFVSVLFSVILLCLVFLVANYYLKDRIAAAAGTAAFAACPGFLLQSSLATAEIIATTVLILAMLFWIRFGAKSIYLAIFGGLLFGLACATRTTCLAILPAILIWSFIFHKGWAARLLYPIMAISVAVVVFTACKSAYYYAFDGTLWDRSLFGLDAATGMGRSFEGGLLRMNYLLVSDGFFPVLGILGLVAWYVIRLMSSDDPEIMRLCGFLLIAGIGAWAAWVLKSPIAHVRYLWPAIPLVWLAAILLGLTSLKRVKNPITFRAVHATIMCFCLVQGLFNIRMLAVGESLTVLYEFARMAPLATPRAYFAARNDQEAIIRAVRNLPTSGNIYAVVVQATYPITYAAGRTIKPLRTAQRVSDGDFLIVVPSDHNIWEPSWDLIGWIQENTLLLERHGNYALYALRQGASTPRMQ
ncbi:glycosyltransferase family 39 protein [Propionivibrio sp.]|uniref:glycosyltransferase family 39 protein n=1 Tax=Propionivibrio sp. TaxID=2212460 RepID=UPI003BF13257